MRAWKISAPARSASAKVGAPTGATMNSWKSVEFTACLPPLRMLKNGHGQDPRAGPAEVAVERQVVRRGGRVGAGQGDAEDGVRPELALVRRAVELDERGVDVGLVGGVGAEEGRRDRLADVLDRLAGRPCRRSGPCRRRAARRPRWRPVEAPDGTPARPTEPSARTTSTSTVGLPRESRISRASISSISVFTRRLRGRRRPVARRG